MASHQGKVIVGEKYNRLTALEFIGKENGQSAWRWLCDCGTETIAFAGKVRSGHTKSCGCLQREESANRLKKHGMFGTPEYSVWGAMIQRCTNEKNKRFSDYGGRGIRVCQRWLDSFEHFLEDMGKRPSLNHQIDRTNNDGNYEPDNCRWVLQEEQARNRRNNVLILYRGKVMLLSQFAAMCEQHITRTKYLLKVGYSPEFIYKNRHLDLRKLRGKIQELKNG